jgi:hypothetical protein
LRTLNRGCRAWTFNRFTNNDASVSNIERQRPPHSLHGAGKILRPGSTGCLTLGNPVPLQAGHLISATGSLSRFIKFALQKSEAYRSRGRTPTPISISGWDEINDAATCTRRLRRRAGTYRALFSLPLLALANEVIE